jgi:hypothetical protein
VRGEDHYGIAMHWLTTPEVGNQVRRNNVAHSGKDADLSWDGAGADNCWEGNTGASSDPPALETTNSCAGGSPVGGDPAAGILVALNGAGITEPRSPTDQPHGGPADPMPDPCAGAPSGCRDALSSSRAAAPVVVNGPIAAPGAVKGAAYSQTTPSTPASTAQIVAGLGHTPTQAELATSRAAALANLQQRPIDVRVPASNRDLVGGAALALAVLSLLLLGAAGAGWLVRRPVSSDSRER